MRLYLVHVGFYDSEIGIYELHSNMLVVAEDINSAKQRIKNNETFIKKKMHIDGVKEILNVDGFDVFLEKSNNQSINKDFNYDEMKKIV